MPKFDSLQELLEQAGYKETRILTPESKALGLTATQNGSPSTVESKKVRKYSTVRPSKSSIDNPGGSAGSHGHGAPEDTGSEGQSSPPLKRHQSLSAATASWWTSFWGGGGKGNELNVDIPGHGKAANERPSNRRSVSSPVTPRLLQSLASPTTATAPPVTLTEVQMQSQPQPIESSTTIKTSIPSSPRRNGSGRSTPRSPHSPRSPARSMRTRPRSGSKSLPSASPRQLSRRSAVGSLRAAPRSKAKPSNNSLWAGSLAYRSSNPAAYTRTLPAKRTGEGRVVDVFGGKTVSGMDSSPMTSCLPAGSKAKARPSLVGAFAQSPPNEVGVTAAGRPLAETGEQGRRRRARAEWRKSLSGLQGFDPNPPKEGKTDGLTDGKENQAARPVPVIVEPPSSTSPSDTNGNALDEAKSTAPSLLHSMPAQPVLFCKAAVALRNEGCLRPTSLSLKRMKSVDALTRVLQATQVQAETNETADADQSRTKAAAQPVGGSLGRFAGQTASALGMSHCDSGSSGASVSPPVQIIKAGPSSASSAGSSAGPPPPPILTVSSPRGVTSPKPLELLGKEFEPRNYVAREGKGKDLVAERLVTPRNRGARGLVGQAAAGATGKKKSGTKRRAAAGVSAESADGKSVSSSDSGSGSSSDAAAAAARRRNAATFGPTLSTLPAHRARNARPAAGLALKGAVGSLSGNAQIAALRKEAVEGRGARAPPATGTIMATAVPTLVDDQDDVFRGTPVPNVNVPHSAVGGPSRRTSQDSNASSSGAEGDTDEMRILMPQGAGAGAQRARDNTSLGRARAAAAAAAAMTRKTAVLAGAGVGVGVAGAGATRSTRSRAPLKDTTYDQLSSSSYALPAAASGPAAPASAAVPAPPPPLRSAASARAKMAALMNSDSPTAAVAARVRNAAGAGAGAGAKARNKEREGSGLGMGMGLGLGMGMGMGTGVGTRTGTGNSAEQS